MSASCTQSAPPRYWRSVCSFVLAVWPVVWRASLAEQGGVGCTPQSAEPQGTATFPGTKRHEKKCGCLVAFMFFSLVHSTGSLVLKLI